MYCDNCGNEIEEGARYCPSCGSAIETTARDVAPIANPHGGQIQSESFSGGQEGQQHPHPSENATTGNSRGRFSGRSPKKGLFLAIAGILILVALGAGGYWWMHRAPVATTSGIVIEKETPLAEEASEEKPAAPEKPTPAPKTVRKAPAKTPTPKASTTPNTPWRYRVEASPPKVAPRAQANETSPLGRLFRAFEGPAPDVTAPPTPSDARGTGQ